MKVLYLGSLHATDSDFPLIREFQKKGLDAIAYFTLTPRNKKAGLISIEEMKKENCIIPASSYKEFEVYKNYLDLDRIYIINSYNYRLRDIKAWKLWYKVYKHMSKQKADIIHSVWPFSYFETILYLLKIKKVFTVHDPFPHSGQESIYNEITRRVAFKKADALVLLNKKQRSDFSTKYRIKEDLILDNRMGVFSWYKYIESVHQEVNGEYIFFWGNIHPHKGVEYLLDAMTKVHETHPALKLVVAGKGKYYFDIEKYRNLDYIILINEYITVPRLVGLLKGCLFSVVPYVDATQSGVVQTAFSLGIPLVVTSVGALPETVKDNVTGLVVPPRDIEKLASAIVKLAGNKSLITEYSHNIERFWAPQMEWGPIADKYIERYKTILIEK